jgi:hypothetical protein
MGKRQIRQPFNGAVLKIPCKSSQECCTRMVAGGFLAMRHSPILLVAGSALGALLTWLSKKLLARSIPFIAATPMFIPRLSDGNDLGLITNLLAFDGHALTLDFANAEIAREWVELIPEAVYALSRETPA